MSNEGETHQQDNPYKWVMSQGSNPGIPTHVS
jgi:hypothetical protein